MKVQGPTATALRMALYDIVVMLLSLWAMAIGSKFTQSPREFDAFLDLCLLFWLPVSIIEYAGITVPERIPVFAILALVNPTFWATIGYVIHRYWVKARSEQ